MNSFNDNDKSNEATTSSIKKKLAQNIAIGASIIGGTTALKIGIVAAGTSATATISAVGATIGGVTGGIMGSSVGLVTGGVGIAATVPFAAAGTAIGGWAGPALALLGIGTARAWAVPVAIAGGVITLGGTAAAAFKYGKSRAQK